MDLIVSSHYQPIYYLLGFLSTGARGQLLSANSEGSRSVFTFANTNTLFSFRSATAFMLFDWSRSMVRVGGLQLS